MPDRRADLVVGCGAAAGVLLGLNGAGLLVARRRAVALRDPHDVDGVVGDGVGQLHLITLGDSVMEGDGIVDPERTLPRLIAGALAARTAMAVRLTQLGRSGARSSDVLAAQLPALPPLAPDAVVLSVGVNDGLGRRPLRHVERDHMAIAAWLHEHLPAVPAVLVGAPDLRRAPALPWPANHAVGHLTGRVGRRQARWLAATGLRVVEMGTPVDGFGPDGFHPGPSGTPRIAGRVVDALAAAGVDQRATHVRGTQ